MGFEWLRRTRFNWAAILKPLHSQSRVADGLQASLEVGEGVLANVELVLDGCLELRRSIALLLLGLITPVLLGLVVSL